jgi:hypothetical protein
MSHVEENHLGPDRFGKGASGSERFIGVWRKIGRNQDFMNRVHDVSCAIGQLTA